MKSSDNGAQKLITTCYIAREKKTREQADNFLRSLVLPTITAKMLPPLISDDKSDNVDDDDLPDLDTQVHNHNYSVVTTYFGQIDGTLSACRQSYSPHARISSYDSVILVTVVISFRFIIF